MKTCKTCKASKQESEFPKNGKNLRPACRACFNAARKTVKSDPESFLSLAIDNLDETAFVSHEEAFAMLELQARPLRVDAEPFEQIAQEQGGIARVLFVPDTHAPYHDKKVWKLFIKAAKKFKPDIIVILGDFADFYSVSSHDKRPDRARLLKDELEAVFSCLDDLQSIPGVKRRVYVSGNHEDRYDRYINQRAAEFYGLMSLPDLLKLKERGWQWVPYKSHIHVGKVAITHECGNAGGDAHKKAQATFEGNVIIGHTHRVGYTVVGNAEGKPHVGAMFGWLGNVEEVDYMHRIKALRDWAHGFGVGYLRTDGCMHLIPVPIVAGGVIIEGELVT